MSSLRPVSSDGPAQAVKRRREQEDLDPTSTKIANLAIHERELTPPAANRAPSRNRRPSAKKAESDLQIMGFRAAVPVANVIRPVALRSPKIVNGEKDFDRVCSEIEGSFVDRIFTLYQFCAPEGERKRSFLIELEPGKTLKLIVEMNTKFESEALTEGFLRENGAKKNAFHHKVSIWGIPGSEIDPLVKLIISPAGKIAELSWIGAGDFFSGKDSMKWAEKLINFFQIPTVLLFDDARKEVDIPFDEKNPAANRLSIRLTDAFSDKEPTGYSWYERQGYQVLKCENLNIKTSDDKKIHQVSQDPEAYREAIRVIRSTTLEQYRTFLKQEPKIYKKIAEIFKKHLPPAIENPTVHDLVAQMKGQTRVLEGPALTALQLDMIALYRAILPKHPWKISEETRETKEFQDYLKATYHIWVNIFVKARV